MKTKKLRIDHDMNEKIATAEQTLALLENYINKLDSDLGTFQQILMGGGGFEILGAAKNQEVLHS